jgi:hypothetical protein
VLLYFTQDRIDETTGDVVKYSTLHHLPINRFVDTNFMYRIKETHYDGNPYYSVERESVQALVERLPLNNLAEYYDNRVGITFEVDPNLRVIITLPPDYFGLFLKMLFFITTIVVFSSVVVSKCG